MSIVVGGLGGGGDVGLAAVIVEDLGLADEVAAVVSFARCGSGRVPGGFRRVEGALYDIDPRAGLGRRFFEDKLAVIAGWARRVYVLCALSPWGDIVAGLEWITDNVGAPCSVHADIGGDGLVTGYEEGLGSYKVDTVAKAALAYAAEAYGWRPYIAVGAAGGEGGGGEITVEDLAATLSLLDNGGAIAGVFAPSRGSIYVAEALLAMADSGMLPLYLSAVRGVERARIHRAYLSGEYIVRRWYKYVIVVDAVKACEASPLCKAAKGRGVQGISRWSIAERGGGSGPGRFYREMREIIGRKGSSYAESIIISILE
ncbi:MAG: DUF1152 domain-containing protein, partial [Candidatus Korarchaeota archaeon]|nr:DUF1152 domain-containing protein [Candidatus Korarchaeota archaeon]